MKDIRIEQAARLANEWNLLGSLHFEVTEELTLLPDWAVEGSYKTIEYNYIEASAGRRFLDVVMKPKSGRAVRKTSYSDGQRFSVFEYRKDDPSAPETIFVGNSFNNEATRGSSARPDPLRYCFIDKVPLHEALPTSSYLGPEQFLGKPSHMFLFKDVFWSQVRQDVVVHLAEDGLFPHRLTFYRSEADRLGGKAFWSWSATTVEAIHGRPIPTRSRVVTYDQARPGREASATEVVVTKVEFGKSYPELMFWRENDTKVCVFDSIMGTITPAAKPTVEAKVVANPIRVPPATDGASYLSTASVVLGLVVLMASLVLRLRRS